MTIDLHVHSIQSDGTDEVTDLVALAAAAGCTTLALTDHDTCDGWDEAMAAGQRYGVEILGGLELSAHASDAGGRNHSVHVLGYGVAPDDPALGTELVLIRRGRTERVPRILEQLAALGMPLSLDEVEAKATDVVGRPHIADAMVARGYVEDRDEAFDRFLHDRGPVATARYTPSVERAIELINNAGGAAVIAHPWARGGESWLPVDYLAQLAHEHRLAGLEVDHVDHDDDQRYRLRSLAGAHGLIVTGSSDYHGTGKSRNPLGANTTAPDQYLALQSLIA